MSAIFGILDLAGQPIATKRLDKMHQALAYWGPDDAGTWMEGHVGLGQLILRNARKPARECLPLKSTSGDLVLVAAARIDNRQDLYHLLAVPNLERATTPDSVLILKAYEKWGADCPEHLLGDWVFAIWDARNRRLFIARDHHGNTGLYYYRHSRFFVFASSLKGLFALPDVPRRLNSNHLARVLVSWPTDGESTAYEGVFRLPPAHAMTITAGGIRVRRYWRLEDAPDVRFGSDQEYIDAFLELFEEAVRCRLRTCRPVGIQLSGGLDSTSVAALAARELDGHGKRLLAFSSVPKYDTTQAVASHRLGDETAFIRATCQFVGNIDLTYITADQISPLEGIRRQLGIFQEPIHAAANLYWIVALFEAARQHGVGALLNGQGGNDTISWSGNRHGYLYSLFNTRRWSDWWREVAAWRAVHQASRWRTFKSQVVRPLLPPNWFRFYKRLRDGTSSWTEYSAINPDFAEAIELTAQMVEHGHDPAFVPTRDSRENRYVSIKPGRSIVGAISAEMGIAFGLEIRDPTVDKRVMEFCLGIPDRLYVHGGKTSYSLSSPEK